MVSFITISILFTIMSPLSEPSQSENEVAVFGAGCFWCVEAIYQRVNGVVSVESGYAGGHLENPTYREVTTGRTGHAEVAKVIYDPSVIRDNATLEVVWHTHNATTLNRESADVDKQDRGAIFYINQAQKEIAED